MYIRKVNANTARNPVARAVAQKALRSAVLDQKLKLHFTEENEPCANFCAAIGVTLSAMIYASMLDKKIKPDDLNVRIVRGGLSACSQMADADSFKRINIAAVERALDAAVELNSILHPDSVSRALNAMMKAGVRL